MLIICRKNVVVIISFSSVRYCINTRTHASAYTQYKVILNGRETWSLTSREQHGVRAFATMMLRKIYEITEMLYQEFGDNGKIKSCSIYTSHQTLLR